MLRCTLGLPHSFQPAVAGSVIFLSVTTCNGARMPLDLLDSLRRILFSVCIMIAACALPAYAADDDLSLNARFLVAVRNGDAAGIDRALQEGAAIDSRNRLGESALIIALKR